MKYPDLRTGLLLRSSWLAMPLILLCALVFMMIPSTVLHASARCAGQEANYPFRMINGLETQRFDAEHITVYGGSAVDNTGCALLNVYRSITVDISAVGMGGRDNAQTPSEGGDTNEAQSLSPIRKSATYAVGPYAGKPMAGWYYVVLAREQSPDAPVNAVLTRMQSSQRTDRAGSAAVPEKFVYRRHLPIAHYYDPATGFRPMYCYGWPKPFCEWTRMEPREAFLIARGVSAETPQMIDAAAWVPGFGRMLRLEVVLHGTGKGGGAYINTLGRSEGEFMAGYVNRSGDTSVMQVEVACTSKQTFSIRTDPGVTADIYAVGFSIAQPT